METKNTWSNELFSWFKDGALNYRI